MRFSNWLVAGVVGCVLAGCSGQNDVPPLVLEPTVAPVTAAATTVPATEPVPESTMAATTVVEPSTSVDTPAPTVVAETYVGADPDGEGLTFSDGLGVKVVSAPGVTTPGDTRLLLAEGLYVHISWRSDPNDLSVYTVFPGDVEILEAYVNAVTTYYRAALTTVTTDSPDFERFYVDAGAKFEEAFGEARAGNYVASLGAGVVLRPYVLGDQRTDSTAVVLDCYLQNEQYVVRGSQPVLADLARVGQIATMVKLDGRWMVDIAAEDSGACA
jgi:hypothetical protein